jgi:hypothetical protein
VKESNLQRVREKLFSRAVVVGMED